MSSCAGRRRRRGEKRPYAVTLVRDPCDTTTPNLLPVLRPPTSRSSRVNYTVCVTPLNFRYNNYHQLVEMVEINRMFGAGHFVFYNYSTGPFVRPFFDAYRREGLVTVIPWSIPVPVDVWPPKEGHVPSIHYFGQVAALNDCLYRCMGRSTLVVFADLDEILVPRAHSDWTSMLDAASRTFQSGPFPGVYSVRSSFFRTDWPSDEGVSRAAVDRQLTSLLKTSREAKIYEFFVRSKMIVWPKAVQVVGVHEVPMQMRGTDVVAVEADVALLHHYRLWFDEGNNPPIVDRSMHRFADTILSRVQARYAVVDADKSISSVDDAAVLTPLGDSRRSNARTPNSSMRRTGRGVAAELFKMARLKMDTTKPTTELE